MFDGNVKQVQGFDSKMMIVGFIIKTDKGKEYTFGTKNPTVLEQCKANVPKRFQDECGKAEERNPTQIFGNIIGFRYRTGDRWLKTIHFR